MSPCWTVVSLCQCLSVLRKVKYIEPQTIIGGLDQRTMKKKKSKRNKGMIWDWVDYSGYIGQPYCVTSCVLSTHAIVNQLCGMVGKPLTPCGFVSFFGPDRAQRSIVAFLFSHNLWTGNKGFLAGHDISMSSVPFLFAIQSSFVNRKQRIFSGWCKTFQRRQ